MLKDQSGCKSIVARKCIDRLTKGPKIANFDCKGFHDFSQNIVSCLATLNCINFLTNVNASKNLHQVIECLPDHMILKWKNVTAEIHVYDQSPNLAHQSEFLRKRIINLDFGDLVCGNADERATRNQQKIKGVHSTSEEKPCHKWPIKCHM